MKLSMGSLLFTCLTLLQADTYPSSSSQATNDRLLLIDAVEEGNMEAAQFLLTHGTNVNETDREGRTPLHRCSIWYYPMLELLLNHNANVNHRDNRGRTALSEIVMQSWCHKEDSTLAIAAIKLLLAHNADPASNYRDLDDKQTIIHHAVEKLPLNIMEPFLQHNQHLINESDFFGRTALHKSISFNRPETDCIDVLLLLVQYGAQVNTSDESKATPLHSAIHKNNTVLRLLLALGAVQVPDNKGVTPLNMAEIFHKKEKIMILKNWKPA